MAKLLLAVMMALVLVFCLDARHVHPRSIVRWEDGRSIDGIPIEVIRNRHLNRLIPFNSARFFKSMEPCEEGLERDVLGVCREVWN